MADRHKTQSRARHRRITHGNHKTTMKQARSLSPWVGERTSSGGAGALSKEDEEIISRATSLPGNKYYSILRPKPSKRSCSERRWNREAQKQWNNIYLRTLTRRSSRCSSQWWPLEKPLYFDPFGQIGFAHFGHNIIAPCKVLVQGLILFYPFDTLAFLSP